MEHFEPIKTGQDKAMERSPLWKAIIKDSSAPEQLKSNLLDKIETFEKNPFTDWDKTHQFKMEMGEALESKYRTSEFTKEDAVALFANLFDDITDFTSELYGQTPDPNERLVGPDKKPLPPLQE